MDWIIPVIAGYGAILSTTVAILQFRATRTRLRIKVNPGVAELGFTAEPEGQLSEVVFIGIVNQSSHSVKVTSLTLEDKHGRSFVCPRPFPVQERLPLDVAARDNKLLWLNRDDDGWGADLSGPIRVRLGTSDDRRFRSRRRRIDDQPRIELITPKPKVVEL